MCTNEEPEHQREQIVIARSRRGIVAQPRRDAVRTVVVRDPGPGFDAASIPDPLDPANVLKPGGRGVFLINRLMDEVAFVDGGREVQMRKRPAGAVLRTDGKW